MQSSLQEKLSIAYLVTPPGVKPLDPDGTNLEAAGRIRLLYEGPDGWIYENDNALPRAFIVPGVEVVSDSQSALARLTDPQFDARDSVILTASLPKAEADLFSSDTSIIHAGSSKATIFAESTNQVFIHTESPEAGILVLNDTWWPGWSREVDPKSQFWLPWRSHPRRLS